MENRPRGREKNITGPGKNVYKRGDGLGTGPVGSSGGAGRTGQTGGRRYGDQSTRDASNVTRGGGSKLIIIIIIAVLLLGGGGAGLGGLFGGGSSDSGSQGGSSINTLIPDSQSGSQGGSSVPSGSSGISSGLGSLFGGFGNVSSGWSGTENTGRLDTTVAPGARAKRTTILGGGRDVVTIMVYMCGTDLESKYGMGTADLTEMASATLSDNVNIIVFTGGCRQWKTNGISNTVNQIYKVERGKLIPLVSDAGTAAMTSHSNLTSFIQYCTQNYPANRNELIFWDHGGGSLSGYGYDEKYPNSGSMSLAGINEALKNAGVSFDFIGFDACLMATLENALMLTDYADYLIASEETEPGVGWYYTDWLTKLSQNTSMSTLEIGKNIVDDFVRVCNEKCRGQGTTLSVVDLAELEVTTPEKLREFATGTSKLLQSSSYKTVSNARSGAREFAASNKIDQVDLVNLAYNIGTDESKALAETLLSAVKYNKTSSSMTDAYGLSIYFPYQRTNKVAGAVDTYESIGMDSEYSRCIQQFASMGAAGQEASSATSSYASNPLSALMGTATGGSASTDLISSILSNFMSGSLSGRSVDLEGAEEYLYLNQFDSSKLAWADYGGTQVIALSEDDWGLVNDLELNVFFDDGEGYIDLGIDNVFDFTDEGYLIGEYDGTWLAIDNQPVPYYHTSTVDTGDEYSITGYVPCLINGERSELILTFDSGTPYGYISGARSVYSEGETETVAKGVTELQDGDQIDFVCDYYSYDGTYEDSYLYGDVWTYHADAQISNVYIDAASANATYRLTDIYGQNYWTPAIP